MAEVHQNLPESFCVEWRRGNRSGYAYLQSTINQIAAIGNQEVANTVCTIKPRKHNDRYFRIINDAPYILQHRSIWKNTITRKGNGNVNRPTRWRHTGTALRYHDIDFPVLRFSSQSTIIPAIAPSAFIPLLDNNVNPPVAPPVVVAPVPLGPVPPLDLNAPIVLEKIYGIATIPQHVIRALLRDAAMQEELCAITRDEIDVGNGAVTSCFHLFEKNAITQWMNMPASQDKCPVCNSKCDVYLLD